MTRGLRDQRRRHCCAANGRICGTWSAPMGGSVQYEDSARRCCRARGLAVGLVECLAHMRSDHPVLLICVGSGCADASLSCALATAMRRTSVPRAHSRTGSAFSAGACGGWCCEGLGWSARLGEHSCGSAIRERRPVEHSLNGPEKESAGRPEAEPPSAVGRPAFSGQLNWRYFMLRAAGSGTRRGLLVESGTQVPSEDVSDYTGVRCSGQCPPWPSSASGRLSGRRARL